MHSNDVKIGKVAGTGAALNVSIGFQPRAVNLINIAAGGLVTIFWTEDMGAGCGYKRAQNGDGSQLAANGVTKYAGTAAGNSEGFTIGADADMNVAAEDIVYIAYR